MLKVLLAVLASVLSGMAVAQTFRTQPVAGPLEHPWSVAFLPDGRFLVTERPGRLRVIEPDGRIGEPVAGLPDIQPGGQGGLLDVVTDSSFQRNRMLYLCFAQPGPAGVGTALASARLSADRRRLDEVKVIFSQMPKVGGSNHFGCRIVEARDGTLFLTLGDRYSQMANAQTLDNHHGKVVRVHKDGAVPADNPFVARAGALPEIWSYGHRNMQGATLAPDGVLWTHEHGPQGGDEINLPRAGANHGWPVITYGENYGGGKIGDGLTAKAGMEQPLHYWVPSIAPSGMAFLTSNRYGPAVQGNLFVGSLRFQYLNRIELLAGKVAREHRIEIGERVRDVRQGPDGWLYVLTDSSTGRLLRLMP